MNLRSRGLFIFSAVFLIFAGAIARAERTSNANCAGVADGVTQLILASVADEAALPKSARELMDSILAALPTGNRLKKRLQLLKRNGFVNAKGLQIEGDQLRGNANGGIIARIIAASEEKHGITFVISDTFCKKGSAACSFENKVYVRSDFIKKPDLDTLLHEIKHTSTFRKNHLARSISVQFKPGKYFDFYIPAVHTLYRKGFQFDEVEARLVGSTSLRYRRDTLEKAREFSAEQRKILEFVLAQQGKSRFYSYTSGSKLIVATGFRRIWEDGMWWHEAEPRFIFQLPKPPEGANPIEYAKELFNLRLRQLDQVDRRLAQL